MANEVRTEVGEGSDQRLLVGDVEADELRLPGDMVLTADREVVDGQHLASLGNEPLGDVRTDEPSPSRNERTFDRHRGLRR